MQAHNHQLFTADGIYFLPQGGIIPRGEFLAHIYQEGEAYRTLKTSLCLSTREIAGAGRNTRPDTMCTFSTLSSVCPCPYAAQARCAGAEDCACELIRGLGPRHRWNYRQTVQPVRAKVCANVPFREEGGFRYLHPEACSDRQEEPRRKNDDPANVSAETCPECRGCPVRIPRDWSTHVETASIAGDSATTPAGSDSGAASITEDVEDAGAAPDSTGTAPAPRDTSVVELEQLSLMGIRVMVRRETM